MLALQQPKSSQTPPAAPDLISPGCLLVRRRQSRSAIFSSPTSAPSATGSGGRGAHDDFPNRALYHNLKHHHSPRRYPRSHPDLRCDSDGDLDLASPWSITSSSPSQVNSISPPQSGSFTPLSAFSAYSMSNGAGADAHSESTWSRSCTQESRESAWSRTEDRRDALGNQHNDFSHEHTRQSSSHVALSRASSLPPLLAFAPHLRQSTSPRASTASIAAKADSTSGGRAASDAATAHTTTASAGLRAPGISKDSASSFAVSGTETLERPSPPAAQAASQSLPPTVPRLSAPAGSPSRTLPPIHAIQPMATLPLLPPPAASSLFTSPTGSASSSSLLPPPAGLHTASTGSASSTPNVSPLSRPRAVSYSTPGSQVATPPAGFVDSSRLWHSNSGSAATPFPAAGAADSRGSVTSSYSSIDSGAPFPASSADSSRLPSVRSYSPEHANTHASQHCPPHTSRPPLTLQVPTSTSTSTGSVLPLHPPVPITRADSGSLSQSTSTQAPASSILNAPSDSSLPAASTLGFATLLHPNSSSRAASQQPSPSPGSIAKDSADSKTLSAHLLALPYLQQTQAANATQLQLPTPLEGPSPFGHASGLPPLPAPPPSSQPPLLPSLVAAGVSLTGHIPSPASSTAADVSSPPEPQVQMQQHAELQRQFQQAQDALRQLQHTPADSRHSSQHLSPSQQQQQQRQPQQQQQRQLQEHLQALYASPAGPFLAALAAGAAPADLAAVALPYLSPGGANGPPNPPGNAPGGSAHASIAALSSTSSASLPPLLQQHQQQHQHPYSSHSTPWRFQSPSSASPLPPPTRFSPAGSPVPSLAHFSMASDLSAAPTSTPATSTSSSSGGPAFFAGPLHATAAAAAAGDPQAIAALRHPLGLPAGNLLAAASGRQKKEIKRRTKTGCLTCRKRRIKCDEGQPTCRNCQKSKRECKGYDPIFKAQPTPSAIQPALQAAHAASNLPADLSSSAASAYNSSPPGAGASLPGPSSIWRSASMSGAPTGSGSFQYGASGSPGLGSAGAAPGLGGYYGDSEDAVFCPQPVRVEQVLNVGQGFPPPQNSASTPHGTQTLSREELRQLYVSVYGNAIDKLLETRWFSTRGFSHLEKDAGLCERYRALFARFGITAAKDYHGNLVTQSLEAHIIWETMQLARSASAAVHSTHEGDAAIEVREGVHEAAHRVEVVEALVTNQLLDQTTLLASAAAEATEAQQQAAAGASGSLQGSDISASGFGQKTALESQLKTRERGFWNLVIRCCTLVAERPESLARSGDEAQRLADARVIDEMLADIRFLLDSRENRDVIYSIAVARLLGPRLAAQRLRSREAGADPTRALSNDEDDPRTKLSVARTFIAAEAHGKGTTQVIQRVCGMVLLSWEPRRSGS